MKQILIILFLLILQIDKLSSQSSDSLITWIESIDLECYENLEEKSVSLELNSVKHFIEGDITNVSIFYEGDVIKVMRVTNFYEGTNNDISFYIENGRLKAVQYHKVVTGSVSKHGTYRYSVPHSFLTTYFFEDDNLVFLKNGKNTKYSGEIIFSEYVGNMIIEIYYELLERLT